MHGIKGDMSRPDNMTPHPLLTKGSEKQHRNITSMDCITPNPYHRFCSNWIAAATFDVANAAVVRESNSISKPCKEPPKASGCFT